mmetsp:Transcript_30877/g.35156  ORF Transcript_30877/g.35156 Transcript_30877/m.35156 type:complete len:115 (-) Transcript_30877:80-424(-)
MCGEPLKEKVKKGNRFEKEKFQFLTLDAPLVYLCCFSTISSSSCLLVLNRSQEAYHLPPTTSSLNLLDLRLSKLFENLEREREISRRSEKENSLPHLQYHSFSLPHRYWSHCLI